ncbi:MAG: hypothetical protein WCE49_08695, partial [Terrimicrobiaceae bacterium]
MSALEKFPALMRLVGKILLRIPFRDVWLPGEGLALDIFEKLADIIPCHVPWLAASALGNTWRLPQSR